MPVWPASTSTRRTRRANVELTLSGTAHRSTPAMIQTGLIPHAHNDLVTDAVYDFYGLRLATCGLDQRCVHPVFLEIYTRASSHITQTSETKHPKQDKNLAIGRIEWDLERRGRLESARCYDLQVELGASRVWDCDCVGWV